MVINDGVASPKAAVVADSYLVGHQMWRIAPMRYQEIHKMLPYPLLGGEGYEFPSQPVMDLEGAICEMTHLIFIFW